MHKLVFRAYLEFGFQPCATSSHLLFYFYCHFHHFWVMFSHRVLIETGASSVQISKDLREEQERVWYCKRGHPMHLGNRFVRSFASGIRQQNDRKGVLPENLMHAINTGKSMLAGILSQASASSLFPMIYYPHYWRPIRPAGRSTTSPLAQCHRSGSVQKGTRLGTRGLGPTCQTQWGTWHETPAGAITYSSSSAANV